jgi:hypothetical protein
MLKYGSFFVRYTERSPGEFVADTACEKLPVKLCGNVTCQMVPGPEECHDKVTKD